jgi:hypothetical protein
VLPNVVVKDYILLASWILEDFVYTSQKVERKCCLAALRDAGEENRTRVPQPEVKPTPCPNFNVLFLFLGYLLK